MSGANNNVPFTRPQLSSLLNAIREKYGYDFRQYTLSTLARRIEWTMLIAHCDDLQQFEQRIVQDPILLGELVKNMSINVTSMFRDPHKFRDLVQDVFPILATYPHIRIWSAGVSSGEEAYSLAILLQEAGLYERSLIYATDFNPAVLQHAFRGEIPLNRMGDYTRNYLAAGGKRAFSKYYTASDKSAHISEELKSNIVFSTHNLVTDGIFNEFHLILCRNVLIYFDTNLMDQIVSSMRKSLALRCFLFLGDKERLLKDGEASFFEQFSKTANIYRAI